LEYVIVVVIAVVCNISFLLALSKFILWHSLGS
jgi:hypothetical protein